MYIYIRIIYLALVILRNLLKDKKRKNVTFSCEEEKKKEKEY